MRDANTAVEVDCFVPFEKISPRTDEQLLAPDLEWNVYESERAAQSAAVARKSATLHTAHRAA
eukprot:5538546-Pleurochrysis_carterae.AAC.1